MSVGDAETREFWLEAGSWQLCGACAPLTFGHVGLQAFDPEQQLHLLHHHGLQLLRRSGSGRGKERDEPRTQAERPRAVPPSAQSIHPTHDQGRAETYREQWLTFLTLAGQSCLVAGDAAQKAGDSGLCIQLALQKRAADWVQTATRMRLPGGCRSDPSKER